MAGVQDFHHACQKDNEMVTDYIRRLEWCYQLAYSRDKLSSETKEDILFGQLQAGLSYQIVKSPAISGSQSYKTFCTTTKAEEKHIAELCRRQLYQKSGKQPQNRQISAQEMSSPQNMCSPSATPRKCYVCGSTQHLAHKCPKGKQEQESAVSGNSPQNNTGKWANMVRLALEPMDFLYLLDSDDGNVCIVRVEDKDSKPSIVMVEIHGVPARGIIDSGTDITIINGDLFQRVATVARLKKSAFKKPNRIPVTYDQKALHFMVEWIQT